MFGGLAAESELSYAVRQFFDNGGSDAYVVRVPKADAEAASITLLDKAGAGSKEVLTITAKSKGAWANNLIVDVDYNWIPTTDKKGFNLTITDLATGASETFANVTTDSTKSNFATTVINDPDSGSQLIEVEMPASPGDRPMQTGTIGNDLTIGDLKNDKDYSLKLNIDIPVGGVALSGVVVTVFEIDEVLPTSVLGLCRLFERKVNSELQKKVPGIAIRCVPTETEKGLRILANFPISAGAQDAQITFAAGTPDNALAVLKLAGSEIDLNVSHHWLGKGRTVLAQKAGEAGDDGTTLPGSVDLIGSESAFTGIYALDKVDLFNLLCIPDATRAAVADPTKLDSNLAPNDIYAAAANYCKKRRAFLLLDALPSVTDVEKAIDWISSDLTINEANAAAYFPRVRLSDPLNEFKLRTFAPCGVIAGLYARIDASRGVWKAPAGTEATLTGVQGLTYKLTDAENGALNPLGLNCLRSFPIFGHVAWGSRTLLGADQEASEWKYVPVRRTALFLEESLYRGTKWVVFEPNDEPLWAQIRLNIGAFMQTLFLQGAFQGKTPKEAYLVKCDRETTTQDDINRGIVNILVGFAPLRPAEFVIIKIQQLAGHIQT